jgi:hypothetical protein
MTQLGELLTQSLVLDQQVGDKCPFCGKPPHQFGSDKPEELSDEVKSKPDALGCAKFKNGKDATVYKYTTASHHLICAIQCYAQVKTLVRMGNLVGYDINCKQNGLPLPTVLNKYGNKNFGELSDEKVSGGFSDQDKIAYGVMDRTRAQWHVGHHAFEISIVKYDDTEGGEDDEYPHETSYDCEVIKKLLKIATLCVNKNLCEKKENKDNLKEKMNQLSKLIASHLANFKSLNPYASTPYFVSNRSFEYAKALKASPPAQWTRADEEEVLDYGY